MLRLYSESEWMHTLVVVGGEAGVGEGEEMGFIEGEEDALTCCALYFAVNIVNKM